MACIEIKLKDKTFRILNDESQSESVQSSDWELVYNFITRGELPVGFWVEGDANIDRSNLFDTILDAIVNSPSNNQLYIGMLTSAVTQEEFINKLIGNNDLNRVLTNSYNIPQFTRNALIISSWANNKNWYGFTAERALLISGNKYFDQDYKNRILYQAYWDLRDGSKRVLQAIENLYKKYGIEKGIDVYKKFTWLANNKTTETVAALYTPYNSALDLTAKEIHEVLKNNLDTLKGYIIKKDVDYLIISRDKGNTITVRNLSNNINETLEISKVNNVYKPFYLVDQGNNYILVGSQWYLNKNNQYTAIDKTKAEELYTKFFGVSNLEVDSIDLYSNKSNSKKKSKYWNKQEPIFSNTVIDDTELVNLLPEGSTIRTSSGVYTKINGEFTNGEYVLDPIERINNITFPHDEELQKQILTLKNIETEEQTLSPSELRLILNDVFDIQNFENVFLNPKREELVSVSSRIVNNQLYPTLQIGYGNKVFINGDTYRQLKLAVNYFKYLQDENITKPANVANPKEFWPILKDIVINQANIDLPEDVKLIISQLSTDIDDPTDGEVFVDTINNTKEALYNKNYKSEEQIDTFIKEAIDKGLYIISCEL